MRKKLNLWLSLLAAFTLILHSCRNDQFPEQPETYNNSSGFQLTSKRVSLSESKHKAKLLPELQKVKIGFERMSVGGKTKASGKVVSYGDGVSIDTDEVIYIENGPDFYTYTFRIERENAPANAPIENLVLSPLSDGTWREMLITYNFTEQEKQIMKSGGAVDLTGKVAYTPLESGTYSSAMMKQDLVCYYKTVSYYTSCSENAHHHGEAADEDGGPCQAEVQSVLVITVVRVCEMVGGGGTEVGTTPGVTYPEAGGGTTDPSGSNGSTNPSQPCDGNGVPTQPQDPSTTLGTEGGCNTGTPTLPNLGGNPKVETPCEKIKEWFNNPKFKEKYDKLTKTTPENVFDLDHEMGVYMRYPPVGTNTAPAFVDIDMPSCSTDGDLPSFEEGMGGLFHTHNNESCNGGTPVKAPSPTDIKTFINTLMREAMQYTGTYHNAFSVVATSGGNYMLMYTGTNHPGSINYFANEKLTEDYERTFQRLYNFNENVTQADIERIFTKFMKEKINKPGLEVYRVTSTSAIKLEYDSDSPNSVKQTSCP